MKLLRFLRREGAQSVIGATDQAVLAATHFILGALIARLGGSVALGNFAFAYALVVMLCIVHSALIGETFSLGGIVRRGLRRYGSLPIALSALLLAAGAAALLALAGLWLPPLRTACTPAFFLALIASSCYWSVKPYCYRQSRPWPVLLSTLIYAGATLASMAIGYAWRGDGWQPMQSIALGATLASWPLWCSLRRPDRYFSGLFRASLRGIGRYAVWALPAALLIWASGNGYLFVMPLWGDAAQNGGLRAVLNLVAPVNTLLAGACTAWLPMLAAAYRDGDHAAQRRRIHLASSLLFGVSALGSLLVAGLSDSLIRLVYGDSYAGFAKTLCIAALLPPLWVAVAVYRAALRAQADPRRLFRVYACSMLPLGLGLMFVLAPRGAEASAWGMVATQALVLAGFIGAFNQRPSIAAPDRAHRPPLHGPVDVIHVTGCLGGVETYLRLLAAHGDPRRTRLAFVLPRTCALAKFARASGMPVTLLPMKRAIAPLSDLRCLWRLRRLIRERRPDIVHLHSSKAGLLGRLACLGLDSKVVYTPHAYYYLGQQGSRRRLYLMAERALDRLSRSGVLATSPSEYQRAIADIGCTPARVTCVPNAVDATTLMVGRRVCTDRREVLLPGRISDQKNLPMFLQVVRELRRDTKARCHLIGAGHYPGDRARLAAMMRDAGLQPSDLQVTDWLPYETIVARMAEAAVVVLTSTYEGFGYVLAEANCLGIPVVGTDVDGIRDVIEHGRNGFLVALDDAPAMAARIRQLLEAPDTWHDMSRHALDAAAGRFDIAQAIPRFDRFYARIAHGA